MKNVLIIFKPIKFIINTANKYNVGLYVVSVSVGLMIFVLIMSTIVIKSFTKNPAGTVSTSTYFDTTTINRLNQLNNSSTNARYQVLPTGRINPFNE